MPQNQPFEIPQQLRELAERNVEQARMAYGQLMDAMAQATGMWMSAMPSNETTSGFKVVRERAIQFAKQNAEACFAAASRACQCQGYPGFAGHSEPLCTEADAGLRSSGSRAWPANGRGCAECAAQKLKPAAARCIQRARDRSTAGARAGKSRWHA